MRRGHSTEDGAIATGKDSSQVAGFERRRTVADAVHAPMDFGERRPLRRRDLISAGVIPAAVIPRWVTRPWAPVAIRARVASTVAS